MLHNILKIEIKHGYIRLFYGYRPPRLARSRTVGEPIGEPTSKRRRSSEPTASSATARRARGHSCSRARRSCSPLGPLQILGGKPFPNDHRDLSTSPLTLRPPERCGWQSPPAYLESWLAQTSPHGVAACALPGWPTAPEPVSTQRVDSAPHGQRSPARLARVRHGSAPAKGLRLRRRAPEPEERGDPTGTR